jgi:hypothetical protein
VVSRATGDVGCSQYEAGRHCRRFRTTLVACWTQVFGSETPVRFRFSESEHRFC